MNKLYQEKPDFLRYEDDDKILIVAPSEWVAIIKNKENDEKTLLGKFDSLDEAKKAMQIKINEDLEKQSSIVDAMIKKLLALEDAVGLYGQITKQINNNKLPDKLADELKDDLTKWDDGRLEDEKFIENIKEILNEYVNHPELYTTFN